MLASLALAAALLVSADGSQQRLQPGPLLNEQGLPVTYGWSPQENVRFNAVPALDPQRLRQWDFFTVANERYVANFTLADIGFARFCSVDLIDFSTGEAWTGFTFPLTKDDWLQLSEDTHTRTECAMQGDRIVYERTPDRRILDVRIRGLISADVSGTIVLHQPPEHEYLSFAMPFDEDPAGFFYENKIPVLPAEGALEIDGRTYAFSVTDSFAVMDWGRGIWPAELTWHWGAAAGRIDGVAAGFNLGYGFGNTTAATENVFVYDGRAHKLGIVDWHFDRTDWMKPWRFTSPDGRFELDFVPVYPQTLGVNVLVKSAHLDKVYGHFSGNVTLDDGRVVKIDRMFGFAEEMSIRW